MAKKRKSTFIVGATDHEAELTRLYLVRARNIDKAYDKVIRDWLEIFGEEPTDVTDFGTVNGGTVFDAVLG